MIVTLRFNQQADLSADDKLLFIGDKKLTYGEQKNRNIILHHWCNEKKLKMSSQIIVAINDEMEQASVLLALIYSGKVPLIINPDSKHDEINQLLVDCSFDAVIADKEIYDAWSLKKHNHPWLNTSKKCNTNKGIFQRLLIRKKEEKGGDELWADLISKPAVLSPNKIDIIEENLLAFIIFSSGTTSKPKGVEITQGALYSQLETFKKQYLLDNDNQCKLLNCLPLHHIDGIIQGIMLAWFTGGECHRPDVFSIQSVPKYLDSIYNAGATHLITVPTMLSILCRLSDQSSKSFNKSNLKFIICTGAHLEKNLWEKFEAVFQIPVVNMYGLTETCASAFFSGPDNHSRKLGTIGLPVNCSYRIIDNHNNPTKRGEQGELWLSSPQLMTGYHNFPEETANVLKEGWFKTGDLVKELKSGHVVFVGRKKNLIISGGHNISPEEINSVLILHPHVAEAIVLGTPDTEWGEQVVSIVVTKKDNVVNEKDIIEWCRHRLVEYKVPKKVIFTHLLPKSPSGKISIEKAQQLLQESTTSSIHNTMIHDHDIERKILDIASEVFKMNKQNISHNSTPQNTHGWDSLAHMELITKLEDGFNIHLSASDIMRIDSIEKALTICNNKIK